MDKAKEIDDDVFAKSVKKQWEPILDDCEKKLDDWIEKRKDVCMWLVK